MRNLFILTTIFVFIVVIVLIITPLVAQQKEQVITHDQLEGDLRYPGYSDRPTKNLDIFEHSTLGKHKNGVTKGTSLGSQTKQYNNIEINKEIEEGKIDLTDNNVDTDTTINQTLGTSNNTLRKSSQIAKPEKKVEVKKPKSKTLLINPGSQKGEYDELLYDETVIDTDYEF